MTTVIAKNIRALVYHNDPKRSNRLDDERVRNRIRWNHDRDLVRTTMRTPLLQEGQLEKLRALLDRKVERLDVFSSLVDRLSLFPFPVTGYAVSASRRRMKSSSCLKPICLCSFCQGPGLEKIPERTIEINSSSDEEETLRTFIAYYVAGFDIIRLNSSLTCPSFDRS